MTTFSNAHYSARSYGLNNPRDISRRYVDQTRSDEGIEHIERMGRRNA